MKGVVPNYLLLKERKAIYMFSTGVVVSCGPSESCVTLSGVNLSGEVAPLIRQIATKQTTTSAKACEAEIMS